jgi:hypothetical protein
MKIGYNESLGGDGFAGTQKVKNKISKTLRNIYYKLPGTRVKHSRERGGKAILVFKAILVSPARGFESKRKSVVEKGDFVGLFETQADASDSLGLSRSKVCNCLNGKRKTHKGYYFEYAED